MARRAYVVMGIVVTDDERAEEGITPPDAQRIEREFCDSMESDIHGVSVRHVTIIEVSDSEGH